MIDCLTVKVFDVELPKPPEPEQVGDIFAFLGESKHGLGMILFCEPR